MITNQLKIQSVPRGGYQVSIGDVKLSGCITQVDVKVNEPNYAEVNLRLVIPKIDIDINTGRITIDDVIIPREVEEALRLYFASNQEAV